MPKKIGGSRLTPADLKRLGCKFCEDMEALVRPHKCRVVPFFDWFKVKDGSQDGSLVIPLAYRGCNLGYLTISPVSGLSLAAEVAAIMPEVARQALETMWLRKALDTDRETGLFSRFYFLGRLRALLKSRRREAARNLSMDGQLEPELVLVLAELREAAKPGPALTTFADRLTRLLAPATLARLGFRRLGFWLEGRFEEIRCSLEEVLNEQIVADPASRPALGWARYPQDLGREIEEIGGLTAAGQARLLLRRAATALFRARQERGAAVGVAFGDLVKSYGRVVQVLPLDRLVINLGRETGAVKGQVFLVQTSGLGGIKSEYKGEVTIFEVADSYALVRIIACKSPWRIRSGDWLTYSRQEEVVVSADGFHPELGFPDRGIFSEILTQVVSAPLALALARLDGYEKISSALGRKEAARLLAFIFEKVSAAWPETTFKTLWWADTLALACPGGLQADLGPLTHRLTEELRAPGPVSFGLVFSLGGFGSTADSLLNDARKALDEATFSGPGQVAVFGPLALNISGDRLFESGDLNGALKEYQRGLALAPEHLNLLNSLGVCYGRLGNSGEALETFAKIVALDQNNMMAHYNLGYTYLLAGRLNEAEEALSRAVELAPDNFETLFHLGKTALELGHLDKALPALKRAGEVGESRPVLFRLLGEALMLAHDHPGALVAFKKVVKAVPNDAYSLSTLGALFADQAGDLPVARSLFQRSVEIDPTNSLYRQRLGRLLFTLGDFSGAEHHLKRAVEHGGRAPEIHYQLGRVAEETGRPGEAQAHFETALISDPAYKPALEKLATPSYGRES